MIILKGKSDLRVSFFCIVAFLSAAGRQNDYDKSLETPNIIIQQKVFHPGYQRQNKLIKNIT